jgi:hypothetical protein
LGKIPATGGSFKLPPPEGHMKNVEAVNLRRYFKHYRTGVVYDAYDYGHKAWPIGKGEKR